MAQMSKKEAALIVGGLSAPGKMPCPSYSLPTLACQAGFKLAKIAGTVCSLCYAEKGFYSAYDYVIEPAQVARLGSLDDPLWVVAMVTLMRDLPYFRWHDAGDLQSVDHFDSIVEVARQTPATQHWLPTREYGMVAAWVRRHGAGALPPNLVIRLSALYVDQPTTIPTPLRGIPTILASHVHTPDATPVGRVCPAPTQGNKCGECRACWSTAVPAVSYTLH